MKLVLKNGEIKEVDTNFIFNNQYNTLDGKRIFDTEIQRIIDDVRLGEFYCCSKKQGAYDEVAAAIAEERSKIEKCSECWWFHDHTKVDGECAREEVRTENKKIITTRTVYEISCAHKPKYGNKCVHDIYETPVLFREKNYCFFCEYPQGIEDMKPLAHFMVENAEKYGIVARWGDQQLSIDNAFKHHKLFGSYLFEHGRDSDTFELSNARNRFRFSIDSQRKKFIIHDGYSYKVTDYLGTDEYSRVLNKSVYARIKNYDKFATWFWQIVDDFNASKED